MITLLEMLQYLYQQKKFESFFFGKHYKELTVDEIENNSTAIIQFLGEVKTKDPFYF